MIKSRYLLSIPLVDVSNPRQNMKRVGNVASNRIYNPTNAKPPIPFDADEVDTAMERFIRQKYQDRSIRTQTRQNTGSTNSDDHPPPLPPKTGSRFGFRSASSIFPLSSKAKREAAATASLQQQQQQRPDSRDRSQSPPRRNKPSKLFGADVGPNDVESNLIRLRDMGFKDDRQNLAILKNVGGDLQKAISTLVKLGDNQGPAGLSRSGRDSGFSSGSRTPVTPSGGISVNRSREKSLPRPSSNPFDMLDTAPAPAPPQSSQSTGTLAQPRSQMGSNPFQQAPNSNPFGLAPSQSQYSLNQAFENLAVAPPSQPLFPNHTGGFPGQQQQQQLHMQSMTPPVPSIPQQFYPPVIYENPAQQPEQQSYNPFMQPQQQQQQQRAPPPLNTNIQSSLFSQNQAPLSAPVNGNHSMPSNLFNPQQQTRQATSAGAGYQTNPYAQQQQGYQGAVQTPASQGSAFYGQNTPQSAQPQYQQQQNPFFQNNNQQAPQQAYVQQQQNPYQQFQGQANTQGAQQLPKPDKRSILDLYNYPQLAPTAHLQAQAPNNGPLSAPLSAPASDMTYQPTNPSGPMSAGFAGNRNPFMSAGGGVQNGVGNMPGGTGQLQPRTGPSRESMAINAGDWQNGRHSPDAWGTISARTMG